MIADKDKRQYQSGFIDQIEQIIIKNRQQNGYGNGHRADHGGINKFYGQRMNFKFHVIKEQFYRIVKGKGNSGSHGDTNNTQSGVFNKI